MDLRSLRYFIAVLEAGSLSRAAGRLYVAQPALTAQIKKLEAELGARLFDRSHAGVTPTPAGLQLYQDAQRLLSDAAAMRDRIQRLPTDPEGSVTLAVPFLLSSLLMGPLLARLQRTHPRIRVFVLDDLSVGVTKAMLDGRADIGVLVDSPQVYGLRSTPLARETMYFCGRDSARSVRKLLRAPRRRRGAGLQPTAYPSIDFDDAAAQPLVLQSRRFSIRRKVEEAAAERGVSLNITHEHDSARVIRSLNACGAGFTFTPACTLPRHPVADPDWIVARVVNPELPRTYTLAWAANREVDQVMSAVLDALAAVIDTLVKEGRWEAQSALRQGDALVQK